MSELTELQVIVRGDRNRWQALFPGLSNALFTAGEPTISAALRSLADQVEIWAVREAVQSMIDESTPEEEQ